MNRVIRGGYHSRATVSFKKTGAFPPRYAAVAVSHLGLSSFYVAFNFRPFSEFADILVFPFCRWDPSRVFLVRGSLGLLGESLGFSIRGRSDRKFVVSLGPFIFVSPSLCI